MSDHDFFFALDLSDEAYFDRMLEDLAVAVLRYAGYGAGDVDVVTREVRSALASGAARRDRRCDVRFRAAGGTLRIRVAFAGAGAWETARALPVES